MSIYADTRFFVSLYLPDRHSIAAQRRILLRPRIWLTPLHRAEWAHAVAQHVFRQEISPREAQRVRKLFEKDRQSHLWLEVDLPEAAFNLCEQLAERHGARLGVRCSPRVRQSRAQGQTRHCGLRGVQTVAPSSIMPWL